MGDVCSETPRRDEMEKRIARLDGPRAVDGRPAESAVPAELDDNPNVKLVLQDSLDAFTEK